MVQIDQCRLLCIQTCFQITFYMSISSLLLSRIVPRKYSRPFVDTVAGNSILLIWWQTPISSGRLINQILLAPISGIWSIPRLWYFPEAWWYSGWSSWQLAEDDHCSWARVGQVGGGGCHHMERDDDQGKLFWTERSEIQWEILTFHSLWPRFSVTEMGNAFQIWPGNAVTDQDSKLRNERHAFPSGHTLTFICRLSWQKTCEGHNVCINSSSQLQHLLS